MPKAALQALLCANLPEQAPMHIITLHRHRRRADGVDVYSCGPYRAQHPTDALRLLLRLMIAAGMTGPAEVHDEDGKARLLVASIEEAAQRSMTERASGGLMLERWSPMPEAVREALKAARKRKPRDAAGDGAINTETPAKALPAAPPAAAPRRVTPRGPRKTTLTRARVATASGFSASSGG